MSLEQSNPPLSSFVLKLSSIVLLAFLGATLFFVVSIFADLNFDKNLPNAIKGEIDLGDTPLGNVRSIPLDGDWHFYWQKLISAQDTDTKGEHKTFLKTTSSWINQNIDGESLPSYGSASYHLRVKLDKAYQDLAIRMPELGSAYSVYVNEQLIASAGVVSLDPQKVQSQLKPAIFTFDAPAANFDLIIQVSNYEYYWGGMWESPRISKAHILNSELNKQIFQSVFILALFFVVCAFNLMQFSLNPLNALPLIVALLCFLLGVREAENSEIFKLMDLVHLPFKVNSQINFLSFYLTTLVVITYFYQYLDDIFNRKVIFAICIICSAFSLQVLFTDVYTFNSGLVAFLIFSAMCMAYCVYGLLKAVKRKQSGALLLLLGSTLLFASAINDMLYLTYNFETIPLSSYGLVCFVLCQNYLTYRFFTQASEQNIVLNSILKTRNAQLEELSDSLEQKVTSRTNALANAKEELEILANQDPLTGIANRRYLMHKLDKAKYLQEVNKQAFCIAMIDFDHFKKINDTLGHNQGDLVLKEGARLMLSTLRDSDILGRWGGEEFLLIANNTDLAGAEVIASKLKTVVQQVLTKQLNTAVSVTVGIARCDATESIDDCLKRADDALYEGKRLGRNQIILAQSTPHNREEL